MGKIVSKRGRQLPDKQVPPIEFVDDWMEVDMDAPVGNASDADTGSIPVYDVNYVDFDFGDTAQAIANGPEFTAPLPRAGDTIN